jgi:hypothetical protein
MPDGVLVHHAGNIVYAELDEYRRQTSSSGSIPALAAKAVRPPGCCER